MCRKDFCGGGGRGGRSLTNKLRTKNDWRWTFFFLGGSGKVKKFKKFDDKIWWWKFKVSSWDLWLRCSSKAHRSPRRWKASHGSKLERKDGVKSLIREAGVSRHLPTSCWGREVAQIWNKKKVFDEKKTLKSSKIKRRLTHAMPSL